MRWFLLIVSLFLVSCETEPEKRVIGHKGEARVNPYLAAGRYMEKQGYEVNCQPGWTEYSYDTSMAVVPVSIFETDIISREITDWVEEGGHLIVTLQGGENIRSDWRGVFGNVYNDHFIQPDGLNYVLERIGAKVEDGAIKGELSEEEKNHDKKDKMNPLLFPTGREHELRKIKWDDLTVKVAFESGVGIAMGGEKRGDYRDDGEDGKHGFVSRELGEGRVTLLNNARPLRNPFIGNHDHVTFLEMLSSFSYEGQTILVYGSGTSFITLLLRYGWRALIALGALILIWLWAGMPRFGPLKKEQKIVTRDFTQHVNASGHFLWQHKEPDKLLASLRHEVMTGYEMDQLNMTELTRAPLMDLFSQRANISVEDVVEALTRKDITDSTTLVRVVTNLQKMRHVL